ncbi:MAG: acyltransferase [Mediterranea massiliensis]|nr:acyltransferase [Mediterranea massiliensis]
MKQKIYSFIYYRLLGWKTNITVENVDKCVICAAPHTTNWDLFIGKLFYGAIGRKTSFMMKKEWFFFPLGIIFKAVGGIPVNRGRHTSLVEQMANVFKEKKQFHLAITPEGTRKANPNWKKGFYYIALKAQVPIVLIGIDYFTKTITATKSLIPTGDIEKDMREIKLYFKDFKGKYPEKFTIGNID